MIAKIEFYDPTLIQTDKKSTLATMVKCRAYGEVEESEDRYIVYCIYPVPEIEGYEVTGKAVGFIIPKGPGVEITPLEVVSDEKRSDAGDKRQSPAGKKVGDKKGRAT